MTYVSKFLLVLIALLLLSLTACSSEDTATSERGPIVSQIPWPAFEEATYSLVNDDGQEVGQGVFTIQREGNRYRLSQSYLSSTTTDETIAIVQADTLAPIEVERTITGEEGELKLQVNYQGGVAEVVRTTEDDRTTDAVNVHPNVYDNASSLFLWRTVRFEQGFRAVYTSALTAELQKARRSDVTLRVVGREQVTVPAGTFDAWRMEIRLAGRRQFAWYDSAPSHSLLKYDNGQYVFLLRSLMQR